MDITKHDARNALGFTKDTELAEFFGVTKAAVSAWDENSPLPEGRQWELRARRPAIFRTESEVKAA